MSDATDSRSVLTLDVVREIVAKAPRRPDVGKYRMQPSEFLDEKDRSIYRLDCSFLGEETVNVVMRPETLALLRLSGLRDVDVFEAVELKHQASVKKQAKFGGFTIVSRCAKVGRTWTSVRQN